MSRAQRRREREACLAAYGGKCTCCGEARYEFLAIDHIAGGGARHRRTINGSLDHWLATHGFPEGYRLLCHNCNSALGFYGYCPHGGIARQPEAERSQLAMEFAS